MRRTALLVLAATAAATAAVLPAASARPASMAFANSTAYEGSYGEPSIAVGPKGEIYVTTPGDGAVWSRSLDGGKTWSKRSAVRPTTATGAPVAALTSGSDSDVAVAANGDVLFADLTIDGFVVSRSSDRGKTFPQQVFVPVGSADREWIGVEGPAGEHVYIAYHELGSGTMLVTSSSDGGKTFLPPVPLYSDPKTASQSAANGTSIGSLSTGPQGLVYVTYGTTRHDTTDTDQVVRPISSIQVSVSADYGLTWSSYEVQPGYPDANYGNFWMASGVDKAGYVYAVYSGYAHKGERMHVWLQQSTDHGKTWSPAYRVDGLKGNSLFGWVAGGGKDVAVVGWYHTDSSNKDSDSARWVVQVAQVRGMALGRPTEIHANASTHVMHKGGICTLGIFCGTLPGSSPDRSMLDFFELGLDGKGRTFVAFSDNANGPGRVTVARQTGGPSAYSAKP